MTVDILGREINPGDFVVYYSNIYQVEAEQHKHSSNFVRITLVSKSKTTKTVSKPAKECCLVDKDVVLMHLLKNGKI